MISMPSPLLTFSSLAILLLFVQLQSESNAASVKHHPLPAKLQTELDSLHRSMEDGKLYHCHRSSAAGRARRTDDEQVCELALERLRKLQADARFMLIRDEAYTREPLEPNNPDLNAWVLRRDIGNGHQRTDYMEAVLTPENVRTRDGRFSSNQREKLFAILGGDDDVDEAGHILANTLGGPNTAQNFFPQHRGINANRGVRPLVDNWFQTEDKIRKFLEGTYTPPTSDIPQQGRQVHYNVMLEYDDQQSVGRPTHITFLAVFGAEGHPYMDMMGGTFRNGENNGPLSVKRIKKQ